MKNPKGIIVTILCIISCAILLKVLLLNYYPDFSGYYFGPKLALTNKNPYLGGKDFFTPFVYPPFVLLFFLPFTLSSFISAEKIWTILSLACLISTILLLLKMYNQKIFSVTGLFLTFLVFIAFPVKFTLGMGQINIVVLFFLTLSIFFLDRKKDIPAGFFWV